MRFRDTVIHGCVVAEVEPSSDSRGLFARTWCTQEFSESGLPSQFVQSSVSRNLKKGTLRGLHYQMPPSREGKLVRCTRGAIIDVVVDIRANSDMFLQHVSIELSEDNLKAIYIPPGCAHGFQTIRDDTDVSYLMTDFYDPGLGAGLRWNDPALNIEWPLPVTLINDRDRDYGELNRSEFERFAWGRD